VRVLLVVALFACSKSEPKEQQPPAAARAKATTAPSSGAVGWTEADPTKSLETQLAEQTKIALAAGVKPHAYLHADWCGPCVEIEKTRGTPKMADAFSGTHIIAIDVDRVPEAQIVAAGMELKVLPIFYRLDDKGHATGSSIDGGAWGENIPDNMAPPLKAFFSK